VPHHHIDKVPGSRSVVSALRLIECGRAERRRKKAKTPKGSPVTEFVPSLASDRTIEYHPTKGYRSRRNASHGTATMLDIAMQAGRTLAAGKALGSSLVAVGTRKDRLGNPIRVFRVAWPEAKRPVRRRAA
jgi:hypothetical protein